LHRPLIFAAASPYGGTEDGLVDAGKELRAKGADAILLDCIGFTERHREALLPLGLPIILSNAVAAKRLANCSAVKSRLLDEIALPRSQ
jgi:protein AroM